MLLSHAQIIEKIKLDTKVNFVAFVRTPWHALGCNASLLKLKEQGEKLNGLVVLSEDSYDRENPLLSADNFNVLADNEIGFELLYFNGNAFSSSTADNIKIKLQSMSYLANHKKVQEGFMCLIRCILTIFLLHGLKRLCLTVIL